MTPQPDGSAFLATFGCAVAKYASLLQRGEHGMADRDIAAHSSGVLADLQRVVHRQGQYGDRGRGGQPEQLRGRELVGDRCAGRRQRRCRDRDQPSLVLNLGDQFTDGHLAQSVGDQR